MPAPAGLRFRAAGPDDAPAIAALHADSWRRHYRGAFADAFLDNDVGGYLLPLWTGRLASPDPRARTILAETDGAVVGLAHTILGEHPVWGAFLDNLHVAHGLKRQQVGTRLLALTGQEVVDWSPASGLYLWVLEQNSDARAFYAARGGTCVERAEAPPPGGDPGRLNGRPTSLRCAWRDPSKLLRGPRSGLWCFGVPGSGCLLCSLRPIVSDILLSGTGGLGVREPPVHVDRIRRPGWAAASARQVTAVCGAVVLAASVTTAVLAIGHHQPGLPFRYPAGAYASFVAAGGGSIYVGYSAADDGAGAAGVLSLPSDAGTGAAQATLDASDYSDPEGGASSLAADGSGNLYYVTGAGGIDELPRGASTPHQLPYSTERFLDAQALAVDRAGDVFVSSGDNLVEIPAGSTQDGQAVPVLIGDNSPQQVLIDQVAVDGKGDLFATTDLGTVVELPARPGGGWGGAVVLPFAGPPTVGGLSSDDLIAEGTYADGLALAVDAAGDVFVSDLFAGRLYELPAEPGGGYGNQVPVPLAGLQDPASVTVDAAGDLFVAGRGEVARLPRPAVRASGVIPTSTVITSVSPAHPMAGHSMRVRVSVTAVSGPAAPAGKAEISDGDAGEQVCTALLTPGPGTTSTGSCQLTEGFGGDYTLGAAYPGAAPFASSATTRPAAVDASPQFQLASPSLGAQASYGYDFVAAGFPAPSYSLSAQAPPWLSIDQATGMLTGTVPPGTGSFTYSVTAASRAGSATAGPFTVGVGEGGTGTADLAARLSCPADALAGTAVTCSLTVTNHGTDPVAGAVAAMTVPGELGAIGDSGMEDLGCESSNCGSATEVVTWQIGKLRAGASATERVAFTVGALNAPGTVTLHGCVNSEAQDGQQEATMSAARLRIIGLPPPGLPQPTL